MPATSNFRACVTCERVYPIESFARRGDKLRSLRCDACSARVAAERKRARVDAKRYVREYVHSGVIGSLNLAPRVQGMHNTETIFRLLSKARIDDPDECWEWMGATVSQRATRPRGYGRIHVGFDDDGAQVVDYAHRVAFELFRGDIRPGIEVCHTCDNTTCINPAHLFVGTRQDNSIDMVKKGRHGGGSRRKIPDSVVRAMRRDYASGDFTYAAIAERYGVSEPHTSSIIRGIFRVKAGGPISNGIGDGAA